MHIMLVLFLFNSTLDPVTNGVTLIFKSTLLREIVCDLFYVGVVGTCSLLGQLQ